MRVSTPDRHLLLFWRTPIAGCSRGLYYWSSDTVPEWFEPVLPLCWSFWGPATGLHAKFRQCLLEDYEVVEQIVLLHWQTHETQAASNEQWNCYKHIVHVVSIALWSGMEHTEDIIHIHVHLLIYMYWILHYLSHFHTWYAAVKSFSTETLKLFQFHVPMSPTLSTRCDFVTWGSSVGCRAVTIWNGWEQSLVKAHSASHSLYFDISGLNSQLGVKNCCDITSISIYPAFDISGILFCDTKKGFGQGKKLIWYIRISFQSTWI